MRKHDDDWLAERTEWDKSHPRWVRIRETGIPYVAFMVSMTAFAAWCCAVAMPWVDRLINEALGRG